MEKTLNVEVVRSVSTEKEIKPRGFGVAVSGLILSILGGLWAVACLWAVGDHRGKIQFLAVVLFAGIGLTPAMGSLLLSAYGRSELLRTKAISGHGAATFGIVLSVLTLMLGGGFLLVAFFVTNS